MEFPGEVFGVMCQQNGFSKFKFNELALIRFKHCPGCWSDEPAKVNSVYGVDDNAMNLLQAEPLVLEIAGYVTFVCDPCAEIIDKGDSTFLVQIEKNICRMIMEDMVPVEDLQYIPLPPQLRKGEAA